MNTHRRGLRKSENQPDGEPAVKKPRNDNANRAFLDEDDPFADDITGEEWEFAASQAELKHSEQNRLKQNKASSFKQPHQPRIGQAYNDHDENSKLVASLKSQLSLYEVKLGELQSSFDSKSGETLLLRDRLSHAEKQLIQEKIKITEMQNIQEKQDLEREKFVQKQIEKCKDEVQFKQAELQESQNLIRNLERKIKSLEHQNSTLKSRSPVKVSATNGEGISVELSTSQNGNLPNVKRIKLVKPESPRISSKPLMHANFNDRPFENSAKISAPLNSLPTDPHVTENQSPASKTLAQKWKLQSNILQHGSFGQSILQSIITNDQIVTAAAKANTPSAFQIIASEVINTNDTATRGLSENVKRYLSTLPESTTIFDNYHTVSFADDASGLLNVIKNHIKTFALFQDMLPSDFNPTVDSSSYHTALTEHNHAVTGATYDKVLDKDVSVICRNAVSSLHVLLVICEHLPKVCDSKHNQEIMPIIGRLCNIAHLNPKTESKDRIVSLILQILTIHAEYSEKGMHSKIFEQFVKIDTLLPLISHKNTRILCRVLDLLNALISFYPMFVLDMVKTQVDCESILCHITDLIGMQSTIKCQSRFELLTKSLQFLSNLVANHQSLLIENSCFSEIYNSADSLLYSELKSWKNDGDEMRQFVIKSALCLLHSCVSVYPDSIPGSRRLHSHQFTMMLLNEFFRKNSDETSFWNAELGRIIETEVKSVMEEGDSS